MLFLFIFFLIGLIFGITGAGAGILIIIALTYGLKITPSSAISVTFYFVSITSLFAIFEYFKKKLIDFNNALFFTIPSIFSVGISRYFLLPIIPDKIFFLKKDAFLMILFSILMLWSGILFLLKKNQDKINNNCNIKITKTIFFSILIGIMIGVLGGGGGFLITPVLHNFLKINIKKSIATSLFIIFLNSMIGIFIDLRTTLIGYYLIQKMLLFVFSSIIGVLIGSFLSSRINSKYIKIIFSIFSIIFAIFIIFKELLNF